MSKPYKSLADIYTNNAFKSVPKLPRQRILGEDTNISFDFSDGEKESFTLTDIYAKKIRNRIKIEAESTIEDSIEQIFVNADWGKKGSKKSIDEMKSIIINSGYPKAVELINYLANFKDRLLSFEDIGVLKVVNFVEAIIEKLPEQFKDNNVEQLADLIKQVHLTIKPGASTSVGMGEGTFTIFGTAKKGTSGDLQWSGSEVEIKTNGTGDTGAVLGGDGHMNKISARLVSQSAYSDLQYDKFRRLIDYIQLVKTYADQQKIELAEQALDKAKNELSKVGVKLPKNLSTGIAKADVATFFNTYLTKNYSPLSRGSSNITYYTGLLDNLNQKMETAGNKKVNLPSQIASLFSDSGDEVSEYVKIFSELKTYSHSKHNLRKELTEFFKERDYTQFNPRVNYQSFQRLVGTIAIICYQETVGFDYLTAGNDNQFTMAAINTKEPSIEKIYSQLEEVPEITFDVDIDAFEGGKFRSQTVFAKSPRIILK